MSEQLPYPSKIGLIAALGSGALLLGAYYFQYVEKLAPCDMCYWQRWPHMAAIVVGLAAGASFLQPRLALVFAMLAIIALLVTAGIGVYHAGVEQQWWAGPQFCSGRVPSGLTDAQLKQYLLNQRMVRCDQIAWKFLNVSMAGWNAIVSGVFAIALAANVVRHIREQP